MPNQTRVAFALKSSAKDKASFAKLVKETFEPSTYAYQVFLGVYACEWRLSQETDLIECIWDGHSVEIAKLVDYLSALGCEIKVAYTIEGEPIEDELGEEHFWGAFYVNENGSLLSLTFSEARELACIKSDCVDDVFAGLVSIVRS